MQLGMIGLGKMGANMVRRLMRGKHELFVYDRSADAVAALVKEGAIGASLAQGTRGRKWPPLRDLDHGPGRRAHGGDASSRWPSSCRPASTIIDGGNSYFKDDVRRSHRSRPRKSPTSMSAPAAASGASIAATAS